LFAVSPFLKKLRYKRLKLDRFVANSINTIEEFDEELSNQERAFMMGLNSYLEDNEVHNDITVENHLKTMMDIRIVIATSFIHDSPVCGLVDSGVLLMQFLDLSLRKLNQRLLRWNQKNMVQGSW